MQIGRLNPQAIKTAWNNLNNAADPRGMLQNMINSNPQLSKLLAYKSPKEAFYGLASEKGINPDDILKMLK